MGSHIRLVCVGALALLLSPVLLPLAFLWVIGLMVSEGDITDWFPNG